MPTPTSSISVNNTIPEKTKTATADMAAKAKTLAMEATDIAGAILFGRKIRGGGAKDTYTTFLLRVFCDWLPDLCRHRGVLLEDVWNARIDDSKPDPKELSYRMDTLFQRVMNSIDLRDYPRFLNALSTNLEKEAVANGGKPHPSDKRSLSRLGPLIDSAGGHLLGHLVCNRLLCLPIISEEQAAGFLSFMRHAGKKSFQRCRIPETCLTSDNGQADWNGEADWSAEIPVACASSLPRFFEGANALVNAMQSMLARGSLPAREGTDMLELAQQWSADLNICEDPWSWKDYRLDQRGSGELAAVYWKHGRSLLDPVRIDREEGVETVTDDDGNDRRGNTGMTRSAQGGARDGFSAATATAGDADGHEGGVFVPAWQFLIMREADYTCFSVVMDRMDQEIQWLEKRGAELLSLSTSELEERVDSLRQAISEARIAKEQQMDMEILLTENKQPSDKDLLDISTGTQRNMRGETPLLYFLHTNAWGRKLLVSFLANHEVFRFLRPNRAEKSEDSCAGKQDPDSSSEDDARRALLVHDRLGYSLELWLHLLPDTMGFARRLGEVFDSGAFTGVQAGGEEVLPSSSGCQPEGHSSEGDLGERNHGETSRLGCEGEGLVASMARHPFWFDDVDISQSALEHLATTFGPEIIFGDKNGQKYWTKRLDAFFEHSLETMKEHRQAVDDFCAEEGAGVDLSAAEGADTQKDSSDDGAEPDSARDIKTFKNTLFRSRFYHTNWFDGFSDVWLLLDAYRLTRQSFCNWSVVDMLLPNRERRQTTRGEVLIDEKLDSGFADRLNVLTTWASSMGAIGKATYGKTNTEAFPVPKEGLIVGAQPGRIPHRFTDPIVDVLDQVIESCSIPLVARCELPFSNKGRALSSHEAFSAASESEQLLWKKQWRAALDKWKLDRIARLEGDGSGCVQSEGKSGRVEQHEGVETESCVSGKSQENNAFNIPASGRRRRSGTPRL